MAAVIHVDLQGYYAQARRKARGFGVLFCCTLILPLTVMRIDDYLRPQWLPLLWLLSLYLPLFLATYLKDALRMLRYLRRADWVLAHEPGHMVALKCRLGWNERWVWNATVRACDTASDQGTTFRLLYTDKLWEIAQGFTSVAMIHYDSAPRGAIVLSAPQGVLVVDREAPVDQPPEEILCRLSTTPRHLPISLQWRALLGGLNAQVGWIIVGLSLIVLWRVALSTDFTSNLLLRGKLDNTNAVITHIQRTKFRDFGYEVYQLQYEFRDSRGCKRRGVAYQTYYARTAETLSDIQPGDPVHVRYRSDLPVISHAWGTRRVPYGGSNINRVPISVWHGVVPLLLGVLLIVPSILHGRRHLAFLREGQAVLGTRLACEYLGTRTPAQRSDDPHYRMSVCYADRLGRIHTWIGELPYPATYGDTPVVLYNPYEPQQAILLPKLNHHAPFFIDGKGNIRVRRIFSMWELFIPLPVIIGFASLLIYLIGRPIAEILGISPAPFG